MAADFNWLDTDASLEWIRRCSDTSSLLISRELFAQKSGVPNDDEMIRLFIDWTASAQTDKRFCLGWDDVDENPDDDLLLIRYDA